MEELNRSVHTWIEESEHSGAGSDDGLSSPSAAGAPLPATVATSLSAPPGCSAVPEMGTCPLMVQLLP